MAAAAVVSGCPFMAVAHALAARDGRHQITNPGPSNGDAWSPKANIQSNCSSRVAKAPACRSQIRLRLGYHRTQQGMRKLSTNRRSYLRHFSGCAEPVESRHQRCVSVAYLQQAVEKRLLKEWIHSLTLQNTRASSTIASRGYIVHAGDNCAKAGSSGCFSRGLTCNPSWRQCCRYDGAADGIRAAPATASGL
jgi:hypothetical protein